MYKNLGIVQVARLYNKRCKNDRINLFHTFNLNVTNLPIGTKKYGFLCITKSIDTFEFAKNFVISKGLVTNQLRYTIEDKRPSSK